jgi:subtilisin family serine protease
MTLRGPPGLFIGCVSLLSSAAIVFGVPPADCHAPGHLLIRFRETAPLASYHLNLPNLLRELDLPPGTTLEESGFAQWNRRLSLQHRRLAPDLVRHFRLLLPEGLDPLSALRILANHPHLEYAELDYVATGAAVIPDDPDFARQWHHQNPAGADQLKSADIRSTEAWAITTGSREVVVAVLDTGCNINLPEFSGRTVPGYDFVNRDPDPADDNGHGTEVAGVLGATGNNGLLVAGVDWQCRIMPVKVLGSDRSGLFSTLSDGIDWAVSQGANVIVLSAGGTQGNATLSNAVTRAISGGVVFVAASHNDGGAVRFPARLAGVIAVGATTDSDRRASFSNFGPELSLVAPGTNIYTFGRSGILLRNWGTSLAAPQVAGAASLLLSLRPELTPAQVRELLCAGADDQAGAAHEDRPGFDPYHGYGRLNIHSSLLLAQTTLNITAAANGTVQLRWQAPLNASAKQPFLIETASDPTGPWHSHGEASAEIRINAGSAEWSSASPPGTAAGLDRHFYRIRIRGVAE